MKVSIVIAGCAAILFLCAHSADAQIPKTIVNAVISTESSYRPWAESKDGCRGLGQIKRETWNWICKLKNKPWSFEEAFDPEKNRLITQAYLEWLKAYLEKRGHFSWDLVFASYNAGPGAVRRYGYTVPPFPETQNYVKKVNTVLRKSKAKR